MQNRIALDRSAHKILVSADRLDPLPSSFIHPERARDKDRTVTVEEINTREIRRHHRRRGPVKQSRRHSVVLHQSKSILPVFRLAREKGDHFGSKMRLSEELTLEALL